MAGPFRGAVSKMSKPKKSKAAKRSKGKKTIAFVKRAPKLSQADLQKRVAELTSPPPTEKTSKTDQTKHARWKIMPQTKTQTPNPPTQKPIGKAAMEIVGRQTERVIPQAEIATERTAAEAMGLKLLRRAVREQNHNRLLPHQVRHDYEYRLRTIATAGIVRLFNSLAEAHKAGEAVVEREEKRLTADKTLEKKEIASKEAFLAALRQPRRVDKY